MKKKLSFILAIAMLCTFTSCGSKNEEKSSSSESSSSISEDLDSSSEADESSNATDKGTGSIENFEFGTVENGVYSSNFNGLKFTAPEGFEFASEEEILSMVNLGTDVIAGDNADLYKKVAALTTVYDMLAQNASTGENVTIMYENIAAYGFDVSAFTMDDYVEAMESQFEIAAAQGVEYSELNRNEISLCNHNFLKIEYNCEITTYEYSTTQTYYLSLQDGYILAMLVSPGLSENDAAYYEACFSVCE